MEKLAGEHMAGGVFGVRGDVARTPEIKHSDIGLQYRGEVEGKREWEILCEDFHAVLLDKTKGELHKKVVAARQRAVAKRRVRWRSKSILASVGLFHGVNRLKVVIEEGSMDEPTISTT